MRITQQAEADALLSRSALALLMGALLDRQMPSEWASAQPAVIARRLGCGDLDTDRIAWHDPEDLTALFAARPAVHDSPGLMARRVQELCRHLAARHDGQAAAVWEGATTGRDLYRRINELPGFGRQKSQIFATLLGKQYGIRPDDWREAASPYGEDGAFLSVADVTGPESLAKVRAHRQQERRAAKNATPE